MNRQEFVKKKLVLEWSSDKSILHTMVMAIDSSSYTGDMFAAAGVTVGEFCVFIMNHLSNLDPCDCSL